MKEIEMVDVLVDITELDVEDFRKLVCETHGAGQIQWSFESEQGHQVNITFRKEPEEV